MNADLKPRTAAGGEVYSIAPDSWQLTIPSGPAGRYRLAQLDDYAQLSRADLPWRPPFSLRLSARASSRDLPGTWGFGLWNDPFSLSLGLGGASRRLPALPNAAWFFFASPPNYLSLRDDLPAQGALAATFRSPRLPPALNLLAAPALPLLALPPLARGLRRLARRIVRQDTVSFEPRETGRDHDAPTPWADYTLTWEKGRALFTVDGERVLETSISPIQPLGLVFWVDNQYAALPPDGRLSMGTLANPTPAWIEVRALRLTAG